MTRKFGVDISTWQNPGDINYDQLSKEIDFAILRVGFTGYGTGESLHKDEDFETHYKELHQRGVPIGVYWYSCANTASRGVREARKCLEFIKGKTLLYPVFIDVEDSHHQKPSSKKELTDAVIAFCETIENAGYYAGIYASSSWFSSEMDYTRLAPYDLWVAQWSQSEPSIRKGIWQYTSKGKLSGYSGNLDLNYAYKDYPKIIQEAGLNRLKVQPKEKSKTVDDLAREVIDGKWGNGEERERRLVQAGHNYEEVQARVNQILGISAKKDSEKGKADSTPKKTKEYIIYTIESGDSLWRIAARFLGDGSRYPEIKSLNGLTSDTIYAGQKLKIPKSTVDSKLKIGDMVKVTASCYATGETVPGWVKEKAHKVSRIEKDKVLLGWPDGIASWLPTAGVKKV